MHSSAFSIQPLSPPLSTIRINKSLQAKPLYSSPPLPCLLCIRQNRPTTQPRNEPNNQVIPSHHKPSRYFEAHARGHRGYTKPPSPSQNKGTPSGKSLTTSLETEHHSLHSQPPFLSAQRKAKTAAFEIAEAERKRKRKPKHPEPMKGRNKKGGNKKAIQQASKFFRHCRNRKKA